ncbi:sensor histidine kinase [Variovorax sp. UMC13]|uniref:sensor histidine kinase n=1 Tax=Variovorax sp. UMC13 TaxID=1862326 RepID=UPI00217F7E59|nr:sensor histidine kinase [Variovorax sp. UMC13]
MALCLWLAAPAWAFLTLAPSDGLARAALPTDAVEVLNDPSGAWDIAAVSQGPPSQDFVPLTRPLAAGFTRDVVWLRLSLARAPETPAPWLLRILPARLHDVTLYAPDGRGGHVATELGAGRPFAQREIADHHFVFPLTVGTAPAHYFVRLHNEAGPLQAQLELWQPAGFERERGTDYVFIGALMGAVALAICMNLCFWAWLKEGLYGHYALYLFVLCALLLLRMGYAAQWLEPGRALPFDQIMLAAQCVFNAVATAFMARIFGFRRHARWAARFFDLMVACNLAALAPVLAGHPAAVAPWLATGSLVSTLFGALFVCYLIGVRRRWRYLLPAAAFSVGTLLGLYAMLQTWLGQALPGGLSEDIHLLGTITHLVLLNVAVADRTRHAERNYRLEKERVWSVTRDAEQALEVKVMQRTAELARANVALRDEIKKRGLLETRLLQSIEVKRNAIKQQHEFVSMVSHEFRTPLAVIDAAAQSLDISALGADPTVKPRTAKIRRSVQRLSMLIENILTVDRLQLEQRPLRLEPVDVELLLRGLCDTFNMPGARRLRLEARVHAPEVEADRSLLEIALQNLMHNALKYSPSERGVRVVLTGEAEGVSIEVIDQGVGVAPDETQHIFEPYYRSARMAKVPGSGLGLHLSREIARRHGGEVSLVATGDDGSTFRLVLPTTPPPPPPRSDFAAL